MPSSLLGLLAPRATCCKSAGDATLTHRDELGRRCAFFRAFTFVSFFLLLLLLKCIRGCAFFYSAPSVELSMPDVLTFLFGKQQLSWEQHFEQTLFPAGVVHIYF